MSSLSRSARAPVSASELCSHVFRLSTQPRLICFAELPNSGELEREDYLPLKLPPLPSIDSAVESWASGASRANDVPIYTAGELLQECNMMVVIDRLMNCFHLTCSQQKVLLCGEGRTLLVSGRCSARRALTAVNLKCITVPVIIPVRTSQDQTMATEMMATAFA